MIATSRNGVAQGVRVSLLDQNGDNAMDETNDAVRVNVVAGTVTVDSELPAAATLAENMTNPTTPLIGACLAAFDGTTWDRVTNGGGTEATALRVTIANDSTGVVSVDDNGGSVTVDLAAGTNTNEVVGDVAHDAGAAGNPLLICGVAQDMDDTAPPNQVSAESDATRIATDRDGAVFVRPFGPRLWSYHEDSSSALTDASVHAAPASGLSLYVTDIIVSTGAATAMNVFFEEGSTKVLGPYYLEAVAGRGLALHFVTPKKITAATALTITTSAAIAHGIDVTGFIAAG